VARRAAWAVGAVTRRIRRAKDGDGGRSKSDGQMQWAGVTTDDAGRIAEKSHELSEGPIVSDGVSLATRRFDRGGEVLFTRAIVQYATQSQSVSHSLAQRTVAIRRPALRAPAPSGAQSNEPSNGEPSRTPNDKEFVN